jgi:hypothetical protein
MPPRSYTTSAAYLGHQNRLRNHGHKRAPTTDSPVSSRHLHSESANVRRRVDCAWTTNRLEAVPSQNLHVEVHISVDDDNDNTGE